MDRSSYKVRIGQLGENWRHFTFDISEAVVPLRCRRRVWVVVRRATWGRIRGVIERSKRGASDCTLVVGATRGTSLNRRTKGLRQSIPTDVSHGRLSLAGGFQWRRPLGSRALHWMNENPRGARYVIMQQLASRPYRHPRCSHYNSPFCCLFGCSLSLSVR